MATGRIRLAGQAAIFAVGHGQMAGSLLTPWTAQEITARLDDTVTGWRSWSAIPRTTKGCGGIWCTIRAGCCRR
jgi:hypothetical protein